MDTVRYRSLAASTAAPGSSSSSSSTNGEPHSPLTNAHIDDLLRQNSVLLKSQIHAEYNRSARNVCAKLDAMFAQLRTSLLFGSVASPTIVSNDTASSFDLPERHHHHHHHHPDHPDHPDHPHSNHYHAINRSSAEPEMISLHSSPSSSLSSSTISMQQSSQQPLERESNIIETVTRQTDAIKQKCNTFNDSIELAKNGFQLNDYNSSSSSSSSSHRNNNDRPQQHQPQSENDVSEECKDSSIVSAAGKQTLKIEFNDNDEYGNLEYDDDTSHKANVLFSAHPHEEPAPPPPPLQQAAQASASFQIEDQSIHFNSQNFSSQNLTATSANCAQSSSSIFPILSSRKRGRPPKALQSQPPKMMPNAEEEEEDEAHRRHDDNDGDRQDDHRRKRRSGRSKYISSGEEPATENSNSTNITHESNIECAEMGEITENYKIYRTIQLDCPINDCAASFTKKHQLDRHFAVDHGLNPYRCEWPHCLQTFISRQELREHARRCHTIAGRFLCLQCPQSFKDHLNLQLHKHRCHERGSFACATAQCAFTARTRQAVLNHYVSVHNMVQCEYPQCGRLMSRVNLKTHARMHADIRPYRCRWPGCGYSATQRACAIGHVRRQHLNISSSIRRSAETTTSSSSSSVDHHHHHHQQQRPHEDPNQFVEVLHDLLSLSADIRN